MSVTFEHAAQVVLGEIEVTNKAPYAYRKHAEHFIGYFDGRTVDSITAGDLERWSVQRLKQVKPGTVRHQFGFLGRLFDVAVREGWVDDNPVRKTKKPKVGPGRVRWLTEAEERVLLAELCEDDQLIVRLALQTGMRRGEVFKIKQGHLDFERRVLSIIDAKTGHRYLPLTETAVGILHEALEGADRDPEAYIFEPEEQKREKYKKRFAARFDNAVKRGGLVDVRFHTLRHTFASRLCHEGADIRSVQALLGHSTIAQTERYMHVDTEHMRAAVARLDRSLPMPPPTYSPGQPGLIEPPPAEPTTEVVVESSLLWELRQLVQVLRAEVVPALAAAARARAMPAPPPPPRQIGPAVESEEPVTLQEVAGPMIQAIRQCLDQGEAPGPTRLATMLGITLSRTNEALRQLEDRGYIERTPQRPELTRVLRSWDGGEPTEDPLTAGQVKALRSRLGLTQLKFGELVGVSRDTVARWEAGVKSPRGEVNARLWKLWEQ